MATWKCDTCGVEISAASRWSHVKSAGHIKRLAPCADDSCMVCKGKVSTGHLARHNRSRAHISALALAEEIRQMNIPQQQQTIESKTVESGASIPNVPEEKAIDLTLDQFIVADCAHYVEWIRENPNNTTVYRNPRSVVYTVINNLYAAIACNNPTCAWWPQSFKFPANARSWREDILHRSIGDVAMAEAILLIAQSTLTFESK